MLVRVRVWRGRGVNVREGGCVMRAEMEPWVPSVLPITECHPISNASVPGTWIWCPRCYEAAAFVQEAGAKAQDDVDKPDMPQGGGCTTMSRCCGCGVRRVQSLVAK